MKKLIEHPDGSKKEIEAVPECGKDFCDSCGACLACQWEDNCINGYKEHLWVEYCFGIIPLDELRIH